MKPITKFDLGHKVYYLNEYKKVASGFIIRAEIVIGYHVRSDFKPYTSIVYKISDRLSTSSFGRMDTEVNETDVFESAEDLRAAINSRIDSYINKSNGVEEASQGLTVMANEAVSKIVDITPDRPRSRTEELVKG